MSPITLQTNSHKLQYSSPIPTPFSSLNNVLQGGIPRDSITELYGPPQSGKTQLLLTITAYASSLSNQVLLIDTETSITRARLLQIFSARGYTAQAPIKLIRISSWRQAVPFIHLLPRLANNSQLIIIDSLASLFRTCHDPQPHKRLETMAMRIRQIAVTKSLAVIVVNHARADGTPAMGDQWRYICPLRIRMFPPMISRESYQLDIVKSLFTSNFSLRLCIGSAGVTLTDELINEENEEEMEAD